jgi:23S rRNA (guanosine2251-2'-O)-methyltransferase
MLAAMYYPRGGGNETVIRRIKVEPDKLVSPEQWATEPRRDIYVMLDNVRSAQNVGSMFRTCDAAMVSRMFLSGITGHPPNAKLAKTALTAEKYVPWEFHATAMGAVARVRGLGIPIVAVETAPGSVSCFDYEFPRPVCLAFGHEVAGVSKEVLGASDAVVHIPMSGIKNSMNVSVAHGVVVFEVVRQYMRAIKERHEESG